MQVSVTVGTPDWLAPILSRVRAWVTGQGGVQGAYRDAQTIVSPYMEDNQNLWYEMYLNRPPWANRRVIPLGLPAAIGRELARYTLMEAVVTVSGSPRADFLQSAMDAAAARLPLDLEAGLCLGGVALKPYLDGDRLAVSCCWPSRFTPTNVDGAGVITGGVFREVIRSGGRCYTKMERHSFRDENGRRVYVVENRAFTSDSGGSPGAEVPLTTVPAWAELSTEVRIENLTGPLFACFSPPIGNNVDPTSPAGVSVYSGSTVGLIREADKQWEKIAWEYYSGRRKIFTDAVQGIGLSDFGRDLFETGRFSKNGSVFEQFTPEYRDEALFRGLNQILKRIEFDVGLAYGTLSDPPLVEKTATEIAASKSRQRTTVKAIQSALQETLERLLYACDVYATLYSLAPYGAYTAAFSWGDGVLDDKAENLKEKAVDMQEISAGLLNPYEYRMKWQKEDEATARANLPDMETMTEPVEGEIE